MKILQLSDLHLENISITSNQLYEDLKDKNFDLIALTGDFLDRKRTIPKLVPYLQVLNRLNAKYGIYAVLGNHDYVLKQENLNALIHTLEKHHCKVLRNESETIHINGHPLNIIGVDDFSTKRSELEMAYKNVKPSTNLVLTHDPNIVLHMENYHFDYLLSGHFHGGQICYPKAYHLVKMGKLARMKIIKGLHKQHGKPFYINEGLGQTGLNIRVGSRPEITIHEFALNALDQELIKAN
ncbi:metallophosphoesterase [Halobacillus karajensis]|uniref:Metallophosphoesterase n=1 Tax=Halobacillus karajensis TaxID=195088 RepID=A0A024P4W6_9BACI|nr:metallophosphoesterase [Halobacillus karajensis]CDQ23930.1 putative metallophosphoesterase [Halobacillus karajensis]